MMRNARVAAVVGLLGTFGVLGCRGGETPQGDESEDVIGGASGMGPSTVPTDPESCSDALQPGPSPIRRLTRIEYNNTILELLGDRSLPANMFPPEELGNGFGNDATALSASQLLVEGYQQAARTLADAATSSERFAEVVGCELDATAQTECAYTFIASFGARAYRRPLNEDELGRMQELFDTSLAELGFVEAVADVIAAMLQAPQFLYRVELEHAPFDDGNVATLSSYELATRLSYLLWGSMPDQALFEQAEKDDLRTPKQVRQSAARMLEDPRARHMVRYFHANLFGLTGLDYLSKSPAVFPAFSDDLGPLLREETERFLEHVVWEGDGKLSTMLTGNFSFMNAALAEFYGVEGPKGERFERVDVDSAQRAGFLTQAGPMAALTPGASTNPVVRGAYVRARLLCDPPPDPPVELMVEEPAIDAELTTRERFEQHRTDPACSGCHRLLDPIGLAFENFDGLGQWRDEENDKPIDARGELVETDVDGPISGAVELMQRLALSDQVSRCYANQWMSFGYGRGFAEEDECTRRTVESAFARSEGDVRELLIAITQADAFMYRTQEEP